MDQFSNSELVPPEQIYQHLEHKAQVFATDFAQLTRGQPADEAVHNMVRKGMNLEGEFYSLMDSVKKDELDKAFPNRGHLYSAIADPLLGVLDRLPYDQLSTEEMDKYIRLLGARKRVLYGGSHRKDGWYYFNEHYSLLRDASPEEYLLKKIVDNPVMVLTPEQEDQIAEHENNVFKLHIAVPEERRIDVLKAILSGLEHDSELADSLRKDKESRGEEPKISRVELEQQGAKLNLISWKMLDFRRAYNPEVPDFVFYVPVNSPDPQERAAKMAGQIAQVIAPLNLPETTRVPGYNTSVIMNGVKAPGLFISQGDRDFKDYLLSRHGIDGLNRYFDPARNHAFRNQPQISEAIKSVI